ncbi:hypothetical protein [Halosimplex pelagicum]|uniref:Uncharacterized protein n=1 Tax=Halosimplex pelagicum TaxID=869886 RepID=A0A7D5PGS3_9EURY|nr:hypothetical protein [Halosimplex pelagicum]QLH84299.1 hypothetical protein HZS54_22835 [Halosimplex pelagicum]
MTPSGGINERLRRRATGHDSRRSRVLAAVFSVLLGTYLTMELTDAWELPAAYALATKVLTGCVVVGLVYLCYSYVLNRPD